MRRASCLLPLLLLACATATEQTSPTTPPTSAAAVDATGATGGAALDAELTTLARTAPKVEKMKLRLSGDGQLVKQSVYHDAADTIPEPVKALAKQKFPKGTVTGYETELYADLGRVYEVEVDDGGKHCEVAADAEGTEVYTECEVDPATLSAAAKATIESVAPGGKVMEAESKKGPSVDETTVEVEAGGQELYLRIGPDGALIEALRRIPAIVEVPLP